MKELIFSKHKLRDFCVIAWLVLFLFASDSFALEKKEVFSEADIRLKKAIQNPEYLLKNWIELPSSPQLSHKKIFHLSLREAILLSLRYNPNIQMAELDRILQSYQLRLAHNEFELQYALAATGVISSSHFAGVGTTKNQTILATPELGLKTALGTQASLKMDNSATLFNNYAPVVSLSITQPLLRGFGSNINKINLKNAEDSEFLNKKGLQQAVADQITTVIFAYRNLILSANNLKNQQRQLKEAQQLFNINEKKVEAGQLEPKANIQQAYQIESLSLMVEQAKSELQTTSQDLLEAIGLDPQLRIAVPTELQVKSLKVPVLGPTIELALRQNMQYLAQKLELTAAKRAYELAKNQQRWQLDAGINAQSGIVSEVEGGRRGMRNLYNGQNTAKAFSLLLTIPFNDINRRSELIAAKLRLEKGQISLLAFKRSLITTITNAITTIQSQAKRYRLAAKQVALAMQSYELEKKKQQAGISTALDVNNTQNQLIQAQAGLIADKIAYLNQIAALNRFLGTTLEEWHINLRYDG